MIDWKNSKRWSDRFLPEIKKVLGEHLIGESPSEDDAERNTDLIVLKLDAVRIACRVRRFEYICYSDEFTIRSGRPSGVKTELTKIIEGWGDYFFYGFSNQEETNLCMWTLGDLKAFRLYFNRCLWKKQDPWIAQMRNNDYSSSFSVFRYKDIPHFLIAHSKGE